jgi:hypothetical protein
MQYFANENRFEGKCRDGNANGHGIKYYVNDSRHECEYRHNKENDSDHEIAP